jgi:hypothetical protein
VGETGFIRHIQREGKLQACKEEDAHPSKSWTATCAAADGFQESGRQAAGPEEDEVAIVVAFRASKNPRPLGQLAEDRSIDRRHWYLSIGRSLARAALLYTCGSAAVMHLSLAALV